MVEEETVLDEDERRETRPFHNKSSAIGGKTGGDIRMQIIEAACLGMITAARL